MYKERERMDVLNTKEHVEQTSMKMCYKQELYKDCRQVI
jgi:hypothetical protein